MLSQQVRAATLRARFRHRLVGRRELAVGIIRAAIEGVAAAARFLFHQFAIRAQRALYADEILLDVLALRITAAGNKFAVASVAQHHVAPALGAELFQGDVRHALALVQPPRSFAIRIAGAGHELAKTPALQHHHTSAILAVFILAGLRHLRGIELRKVDRVLFRKRATFRIILLIRTACVKRSVLAPLKHQRRTAPLALLVGGLLHPLHVFHVLFSVAEVLLKLLVELAQRVSPLLLALFNLVQLFFKPRRVSRIKDFFKVLDQKIGHHQPRLRRYELAADLLYVLPLLDGRDNGRVCRWPSDAALFQFLHQRRFVESRRRLSEVLFGLQFTQRELLAHFQWRQLVLERLIFFVLGVL